MKITHEDASGNIVSGLVYMTLLIREVGTWDKLIFFVPFPSPDKVLNTSRYASNYKIRDVVLQ